MRVEFLEDRTLLSGLVLATEDPLTGLLSISGDSGNNAITISQISPGVLRVSGDINVPPPPARPDVTSVDGVTFHDFTLGTISAIAIQMLNGTDKVTMTGFNIPGNISINAGSGQDTFSLSSIQTNAGIISITATGAGADTVSEDTIVAGNSVINTGTGSGSITQNNVTFGIDTITIGGRSSSVSVTNSLFAPASRPFAIGQLMIKTAGRDTVTVDKISVGPATVTIGDGDHDHPNNFQFDDSTLQSGAFTVGTEASGARSFNFTNVSNDIVTGSALSLNLLNQRGVSGILQTGATSSADFATGGALNFLTMNNVQFSGGGNLNLRVDDGIQYFVHDDDGDELIDGDNGGYDSNPGGSKINLTLIDSLANDSVFTIHLGDHMQNAILGAGTIGLNDLDSGHLIVTVGSDNATVVVSAIEADDETVSVGDVYGSNNLENGPFPIQVLPAPPSVTINGTVGVTDTDNDGDGLTIMMGNNNNNSSHPIIGWPVNVQETVKSNLTIQGLTPAAPPNGLALNVSQTSVSGDLTITSGDRTQSVAVTGTTAQNLTISAMGGDTYFYLNGDTINNDLNLTTGNGNNTLALLNLNVVDALFVTGGAGINTIVAQNVTCLFGMIDGGSGPSNIYVDRGGNFGFFVFDVVGRIAGPFPPQLDASNLNLSAATINQGDFVTLTGTFSQTGNWDSHTVTINWGDGSANTQLQLAPGVFSFSAAHQFLNETSGSTPNVDNITVTVTNSAGDTATASTSLTVTDVPPVIPAGGLQVSASTINEGGSTALTGAFVDPGVSSTHQVVINWGDGSTTTTLQLDAGVLSFGPISHTYQVALPADAPYIIQVTVSDEDNASGRASIPVTVKNVPPTNINLGFTNATINAGDTATLNGSFTDPAVLDTHSVVINWGDGSANTTVSLGANSLNFSANHQYQSGLPGNAPYTVQVTVSDEDNASASASTSLTVNQGTSTVGTSTVNAGPDQTVPEETAVTLGETLDPSSLNGLTFHWTVVSSNGQVIPDGNGPSFTFTPNDDGQYTGTLTVTDSRGGVKTSTATVTATHVAPTLMPSGAASVGEGSPYTLDLSSREPGADTITSWTITWGDGAVQTVNGNPNSVTHVYPEGPNSYTILAQASDEDGTYDAANSVVVQVTDVPPTVTLSGPTTSNPLSPYTLNLSASDPGTDSITSWTINWGDGTIQPVDGNPSSATHTYALVHRAYTISAQATNGDGTFSAGNTLTVNMSFATPNENYIAQVYLDLLGRPVDLGGLQSWTGHLLAGASRDQVMLWIMSSPEYRTLLVEELYKDYLGRAADPLGLRNDLLAMAAGATTDQIKAGILGSDEYFSLRASGTINGFFSALYYDVLGRSGTPSEIQTWVLGEPADASRTALASLFIGSVEANQFLVQSFYEKYLHRAADPAGLSAFVQARDGGATEEAVIAAILASDEYYNHAVN